MARRLALVLVTAAAACTGTIEGGGHASSADPGEPDASVDAPPGRGAGTIARATLWVDAQVPYCQAPNHGKDEDSSCAAICTRPDNPAWDPYRSDCSGFVSWSWALPAPGRTTADLAPFTTDLTHVIDGAELAPGDALNNDEHVILFAAWLTVGKRARLMEEPGCSSPTPYAHEFTADVTLDGSAVDVLDHGTFTAIRYDAAP